MSDAYPVEVPPTIREPLPRLRRPLLAIAIAVALLAVGCSGSDDTSGNIVPIDAPAPGVVYATTSTGDLQLVEAESGAATVVISATADGASPVVDLGPAPGEGLHALVQSPDQALQVGVAQVTTAGLELFETSGGLLACLDPQHNASSAVALEVEGNATTGTQFSPVLFAGGALADNGFDLTSVACPRWTSDRDTVATAIPLNSGDPSSIVTIVQTGSGERHEIGFEGCGTTPTSISPDDQFLALSLTCYSARWESSGLYLVALADVAQVGDLDALTELGDGLYGRTSWHPDGEWVAGVHADPIPNQNFAQDLTAQPVAIQLIEVKTGQIVDVVLADNAAPFSVAWLGAELGG